MDDLFKQIDTNNSGRVDYTGDFCLVIIRIYNGLYGLGKNFV